MNSLAFYGLRGGAGVTSVVAALGYALHALGQRVLLVDLTGDAMLGLHFNCPVSSLCATDGEALWEIVPGLDVLILGPSPVASSEAKGRSLAEIIAGATAYYDQLLVDAGNAGRAKKLADGMSVGLRQIEVVPVDAAAHVRLYRDYRGQLLLVNNFAPESRLQNDLLMLWQHQPELNLLPVTLHQDEAWNEALACKQPLALARPQSQAAQEIASLAVWCMAQAER